jgi:arylsulfatase A-like enzyme
MLIKLVLLVLCLAGSLPAAAAPRPNVLWIIVDDMSPHFSCYGEKLIATPQVDRLAAEGTRFSQAHVTAPVCSPCRSALITGMMQTSIGAHHHRSGRGKVRIALPSPVEPVPVLFRRAGYYTCIGNGQGSGGKPDARGKTDYNFDWDKAMYDGNDWSGRKEGQPFFMQVQLPGGKLRGNSVESAARLAARAARELGSSVKPEEVTLPPYYPRDPVLLQDWAAYLDSVRLTDRHVGQLMTRLEKEGLLENTVILFLTDHGISHARGKQFLYEEGSRVAFVLRGPGVPKGQVREDLVSANIDAPALSLAAAGLPVPDWMQGRDVLARDYQPRDMIFAARDRCDETVDGIRSVRTAQWKYIRNFYPQRPLLQPNAYKDGKAILQTLRRLHDGGKLDALPQKLLFAPARPAEELYHLTTDPWELTNLAADPDHSSTLFRLRGALDQWMEATGDQGRQPESATQYDSDMDAVDPAGGNKVPKAGPAAATIELMKRWATERPLKVEP